MRQEYSYTVERLDSKNSSILSEKDKNLVSTYISGIRSFNPDESRLDVVVSSETGDVLETYRDVPEYTVHGVVQGSTKINQLEVDPTIYLEGRTYLGDVVVEYKAFNNLYSRDATVFLSGISSDRTEIQVKSFAVSLRDLQYYTNKLQYSFENQSYSTEAFLEISDTGQQIPIVNATTEVVGSETVAVFKLYEPLPDSVGLKDVCQILESLGESSRFLIKRTTVVVEDPVPELKGPNFSVEVGTSTISTDYKNFTQLLSQKSWESSKGLYTAFKKSSLHTSINYEDFGDFIHFSSAVERLENARYKFEKIFEYQSLISSSLSEAEKSRYQTEIDGIVENFDHYENYLYFESGSKAWPKKFDEEVGCTIRPYENETNPLVYEPWYNQVFTEAEGYDNNNKDILISTIPAAIREDLDHNEPYLIFIHMIGQHFDDLWVYAQAITNRYKADNRPEFGISKELVKDALESFGLNLYESNQNLNALFELCQPDGTYDPGLETAVTDFKSISGDPALAEAYTKEVYKRIYHNIPTLLKTKGTSRGLRVLINCFGIPSDILAVKVRGGVDSDKRPFFGPEEAIAVSPEFDTKGLEISGSIDKVRTKPSTQILEYTSQNSTGSFFRSTTLSRYTNTTASVKPLTDDLHQVEVGFDLNEAVNRYFKENLGDFTVDDVLADPSIVEEDYGDAWKYLRESLLNDVAKSGKSFRSPAAIIRLVRYFDTTLFRMLKDFLPARSVVETGAIVKDNALHRNRWRGVNVSWLSILETGSISGSTVKGTHGGAFLCAGQRFETTKFSGSYYNPVSTGDKWVDKPVISGSREYTGELGGTQLGVVDIDLTKNNEDRKAKQPGNDYDYNFWFLGLPDLPLCSAKIVTSFETYYRRFTELGLPTASATLGDQFNVSLKEAETYHAFDPSMTYRATAQTHWRDHETVPETFMGWFTGSLNYGHPHTVRSMLQITPAETVVEDCTWTASYCTGSRNVLWFYPYYFDSDYGYFHYYYKGDIILTWKYLDTSQDPEKDQAESGSGVWGHLGDTKLLFQCQNTVLSLTLPETSLFGTSEGYWWVNYSSGSLPENYGEIIDFLGVKALRGNYTGPFISDGTVVDSQWYGNHGEWPWKKWEISKDISTVRK